MSGIATRIPVDANEPATSTEAVPPAALHDARLSRVIQLIRSETPHTIPDLAARVNLSPSHLQHLFKEHVGVSMTRLLAEERLQRAARLLSESDLSVKQIAFAVGYEHASSFVRAFQHRFSQTPRAYRKRMAEPANTTAVPVNFSLSRS